MAIQSFSDEVTEDFFISGKIKKGAGWILVSRAAKRRLDMLHYADRLDDLRAPPGNRLEMLKGNLKGYYSIRINNQWRIIFRWSETEPSEVCISDYH
jgi:proteic killer suppression protein